MIHQIKRDSRFSKQTMVLWAIAYIAYISAASLAGQGVAMLFHKFVFIKILK